MVCGNVCGRINRRQLVLCAKVVGCTLPMAAEKLGIDPAVMASPFITTIVDACSLILYFQIAQLVFRNMM